MKKASKILVSIALLVMMFFSVSMIAFAKEEVLKVGENGFLMQSETPYISSNTSVVQIQNEGGTKYSAVAVGEGVAIVSGGSWMGNPKEDYVFVVTNYDILDVVKQRLEIGEAYPINLSSDIPYVSSDTSVIEIRDEGNSKYSAVAVGDGVATVSGGSFVGVNHKNKYIFIVGDVASVYGSTDSFNNNENDLINDFENNSENHQNSSHQIVDKIKRNWSVQSFTIIFIFVFFIPLFAFAIYSLISVFHLSATSTKKKNLPEVKITANTITSSSANRNTFVVPIKGIMTAKKFENTVNEWFAQNPYVYNCKIKFNTSQSLLSPLVNFKFFVRDAVIEYSVATQPQNTQYAWAFLYKYRLFGPIGYSNKKLVEKWQTNNPDCHILSTQGGRIQHFGSHGFYAQYYEYIFFQKNSQQSFATNFPVDTNNINQV